MFLSKKPKNLPEDTPQDESYKDAPKYPRPQILLMDMEPDVEIALRNKGFNVSTGSFGKPYQAERRNDRGSIMLHPIYRSGFSMPEFFAEHEIVIVDNAHRDPVEKATGNSIQYSDGSDLSVQAPQGSIDPRPINMAFHQEEFDRILQHGGVFVVFAGPRTTLYGYEAWSTASEGFSRVEDPLRYVGDEKNTWSFLSCLRSRITCTAVAPGKEIRIEPDTGILGKLFESFAKNATFDTTLTVNISDQKNLLPLAKDKFGNVVAAAYVPDVEGIVFLLPNLHDKAGFLVEFMASYLPEVKSELFPSFEGHKWVRRPEYAMPPIVDLRQQIEEIELEANRKIEELKRQIEEKQDEFTYFEHLLNATDSTLVAAVQKALEVIGFAQVVDMDHELAASGSGDNKREDLQIRDESPLILVEVKGITGLVKDKNALQVVNYIAPRMKQLDRVDIRGLSVVNHQRHIPALERNPMPFSEDVLETSHKQDIGLLTTWSLYKLVRSYLKLGWTHEQVSGLFYVSGYIEVKPSHYEYVGLIEKYWERAGAIEIRIERDKLNLHDRIAFELPNEFEEQSVESLQEDRAPVQSVEAGHVAGVLTTFPKDRLRKGTRVFRIALPQYMNVHNSL